MRNGKTSFYYSYDIPGKAEMMVEVRYTVADLAMVILPRDPHWTRHPPASLEQSFCTWLKDTYKCVDMYTHMHIICMCYYIQRRQMRNMKSRELLMMWEMCSFLSTIMEGKQSN